MNIEFIILVTFQRKNVVKIITAVLWYFTGYPWKLPWDSHA